MKTKITLLIAILVCCIGSTYAQSISSNASKSKKGDCEFVCPGTFIDYTFSFNGSVQIVKWIQIIDYLDSKGNRLNSEVLREIPGPSNFVNLSWNGAKAPSDNRMPKGRVIVRYKKNDDDTEISHTYSKSIIFLSLNGLDLKDTQNATSSTIKLDYFVSHPKLKAPPIQIQYLDDPASPNMKNVKYSWVLNGFSSENAPLDYTDGEITVNDPEMYKGTALVKAFTSYCGFHNDFANKTASNEYSITIARNPIYLNVTKNGGSVSSLELNDKTPLTLTTNSLANATSYEWSLPAGWTTQAGVSGTISTTGNTLEVIPSGYSGGTIKVFAKKNSLSTPAATKQIDISISIQGPADVNPKATYTISNPYNIPITWSVTPNLTILSQNNSSVTVFTKSKEKKSPGKIMAFSSENSAKAEKAVNVYGITCSGPSKALTFETITVGWDNIPPNATNIGTWYRIMHSKAENYDYGTGEPYSFIAEYAGRFQVQCAISFEIGPNSMGYTTDVFVDVEDDGARRYISGPAVLRPGEVGTYVLANSRDHTLIDDAARRVHESVCFADTWRFSSSYLELIASSPTSITVRNRRPASDVSIKTTNLYLVSEFCPASFLTDIELHPPVDALIYRFEIENVYGEPIDLAPEPYYLYVFRTYPYIYDPLICERFWLYDGIGAQPRPYSFNLWTLTPDSYELLSNQRLFNYCYPYVYDQENYCCMLLHKSYTPGMKIFVQHVIGTVDGRSFWKEKFIDPPPSQLYGSSTYSTAYPNPASNSVSIKISADEKSSVSTNSAKSSTMLKSAAMPSYITYEVYNQQSGQLVKQGKFETQNYTLDVSTLRDGIYLLKLNNNGAIETHRIVVKH